MISIVEFWNGDVDQTQDRLVFRVREVQLQRRQLPGDLEASQIGDTRYDGALDLQIDAASFNKMKGRIVARVKCISARLQISSEDELQCILESYFSEEDPSTCASSSVRSSLSYIRASSLA